MNPSTRMRAEVWLWRYGWAWLLSAALLATSSLVYWLACGNQGERLQAIARERVALQQRLDVARQRTPDAGLHTAGPGGDTGSGGGDTARRQAVDDVLASAGQPDAQVRRIASIAAQHGIMLLQSDYQYTHMKDAGITAVQLSMPVHAAYPQLRLFVKDVLLAMPNASLDQVSVKRDNVAQDQAEARLKWTLWAKGPAPLEPAERSRPVTRPASLAASAPLEALVPRSELLAAATGTPTALRDLFATGSWNPPAPAVVALPPPAPAAPPLPFAYLGMKHEGDTREVYLSQGEQTLIAREGAQLLNVYRVEKISPSTLTLTYLPLGQVQTLPIGDFR